MSLVKIDGSPLPPSDVIRGVQRVDPSLDMIYLAIPKQWAVVAPWRLSDPRHAMVQKGELGAGRAYDIVTILPQDCPVDDAESYLRRGLRQSSRDDVLKMLDRVSEFNERRIDDAAESAVANVMDDASSAKLTNTAKVGFTAALGRAVGYPKKKGK